MKRVRFPVFASCLLALESMSASAQTTTPDSAAYLIARGRDTAVVEWSVRNGNRLHILTVSRASTPVIRRYDVLLGADGAIERMEVFDAAGTGPVDGLQMRARIYARGDSTIEERFLGTTPRLATPGRTHVYNSGGTGGFLFSMLPPLAATAPGTVGDSIIGQHVPGTLGPSRYVIRRDAPDVVSLGSSRSGMMRVRYDRTGRATQVDAMASSFNVVADRIPWMHPDSVVRMFAAMERARPIGPTAPRDSVIASFDGARIVVDYGRPSKRGRTIFGGIVPWNRVWRTGANLATHLTTSRPLAFGNVVIPAGQYTLWTIPAPDRWTLIISRQTTQWGTDYDATHDLARIPLRLRTLPEPVEQFTIAVEARRNGGVLRLIWDTTEASTAFALR